jgi:hypothetical protein
VADRDATELGPRSIGRGQEGGLRGKLVGKVGSELAVEREQLAASSGCNTTPPRTLCTGCARYSKEVTTPKLRLVG